MKKTISLSLVLISLNCFAQKDTFSIIGKWQQTAYRGNDGARDFVQEVKNGRILIFENAGIIKDSTGVAGNYRVQGDSLQIVFPYINWYYRFYYSNSDPGKLVLAPVTKDYQFICDEGCSEIFVKTREEE